jgi:hypothetical protein
MWWSYNEFARAEFSLTEGALSPLQAELTQIVKPIGFQSHLAERRDQDSLSDLRNEIGFSNVCSGQKDPTTSARSRRRA